MQDRSFAIANALKLNPLKLPNCWSSCSGASGSGSCQRIAGENLAGSGCRRCPFQGTCRLQRFPHSQTHMLAFTKGGKTLVATNRGSDNVSIFELTASDPLFRVPGMEGDDRARMRGT